MAALIAGSASGVVRAQDATWAGGNAVDPNEWVENNNWIPATVPTGTATFGNVAATTTVANDNGVVAIGGIQFTATALAYTFNIDNPFIVNGAGVANNSANTQTFNITSGNTLVFQNNSTANSGTGAVTYNNSFFIFFQDTSNAGNANTTIVNNDILQFNDSSSAGSANITNNVELDFFNSSTAANASVSNAGGIITFNNTSTAGNASILSSLNGTNAAIFFNNSSSAGNATFTSNPGNFPTYTFNNTSTAASANFQLVDATLIFNNSSTAGNAILNMPNAMHSANITFNDTSSAGNSIITNVSSTVLGTSVNFLGVSTAGNATISNNPSVVGEGGILNFGALGGTDTANAGTAHITNNQFGVTSFLAGTSASSATITNNTGGNTNFQDQSTAANATIMNNGGATNFGVPLVGTDTATAGNANITNNGGGSTNFYAFTTAGSAVITNNSLVTFLNNSNGGNARFINNAGGTVDFSQSTGPASDGKLTAGSFEGAGQYFLGSNQLTVGGNNLSTTVSGVISDGGIGGGAGGSLVKAGTGTLMLSGINTYTGPTTVNAGTLSVNGSIAASSGVTVNSGATLAGNGTVSSTVINAGGTISPGNSIGTLNVSGNLTFAHGSTYLVEVSPTAADRINISGNATLGGTVQAVFLPGQGIFSARSYTILSAAGGRTGTFDALNVVNQPSFLTISLGYTSTDVLLMSIQSQINQPINQPSLNFKLNLTPNQAAVAATLDNSFNSGHGTFAGLFGVPASQLPAALNALSGEGSSGTQETAFGAGNLFIAAMTEQGAFWRSGDPLDTSGVTIGMMQYAPSKPLAPVFKAMPIKAPPVPEQRWRAWATGFDGSWRLDGEADPGSAGLRHDTGGGAAGLDYQASANLLLGVAAGGSVSSFSVPDRATSGTLEGAHFGTYGVTRTGPWYAAGALAFNAFDNKTNRTIAGVGMTELASGRFNSEMLSGRFELGVKQAFNGFAVTPFAAVQFAELWQAGYTEASTMVSGAPGILGLSYTPRNISSLPTFLGAQLDTRVPFANGAVWSPYARVSWVHEFDPVREITASFIALPVTGFTVDGPRAARDAVRIDAGSKIAISKSATLFSSFEGEFSDRSRMYAGKGGLKFSW